MYESHSPLLKKGPAFSSGLTKINLSELLSQSTGRDQSSRGFEREPLEETTFTSKKMLLCHCKVCTVLAGCVEWMEGCVTKKRDIV